MITSDPDPLVRRSDEIEFEAVDAADGLSKGVLIGDDHDAPNFALRKFTLEAGSEVPKHTNEVEHVQYVLEGEYVVGIGSGPGGDGTGDGDEKQGERREREDEEHLVSEGDSLLIPAGTVHWYRNESDDPGAFLCAVPNGDDEIQLVE
ncbi:cupin domain-containing protein [Natronoglomus mannanivorans]|uniref:Cupin domain-containing protein n=1 Tax=Natronoglomus mannanivorans TaxID=2979990 RepID=A0AAP2YYI0_9EURY|nr:cupin domain-containing protein [Halobacteria archaeon AArc-xg1-1]